MNDCVVHVVMHAIRNNNNGDFYVERNVKDINVKVIEPQCIYLNKWIESGDGEYELEESDDDAERARFDDSEYERTTALNDEFKVIKVDRPKDDTNKVEIRGKSYRIKACTTKPSKKKLEPMIDKAHKTKYSQIMDEWEGKTWMMNWVAQTYIPLRWNFSKVWKA